MEKTYTVKDIADMCGITESAVRTRCENGSYPHAYQSYEHGKNVWHVHNSDFEAYESKHQGETIAAPRKDEKTGEAESTEQIDAIRRDRDNIMAEKAALSRELTAATERMEKAIADAKSERARLESIIADYQAKEAELAEEKEAGQSAKERWEAQCKAWKTEAAQVTGWHDGYGLYLEAKNGPESVSGETLFPLDDIDLGVLGGHAYAKGAYLTLRGIIRPDGAMRRVGDTEKDAWEPQVQPFKADGTTRIFAPKDVRYVWANELPVYIMEAVK